jgi:hypothetical protein
VRLNIEIILIIFIPHRNELIVQSGGDKNGRCFTKGGVPSIDFEVCCLSSDLDEKYKFGSAERVERR